MRWIPVTEILPEEYDEYEYCPECGQKIDWS